MSARDSLSPLPSWEKFDKDGRPWPGLESAGGYCDQDDDAVWDATLLDGLEDE